MGWSRFTAYGTCHVPQNDVSDKPGILLLDTNVENKVQGEVPSNSRVSIYPATISCFVMLTCTTSLKHAIKTFFATWISNETCLSVEVLVDQRNAIAV